MEQLVWFACVLYATKVKSFAFQTTTITHREALEHWFMIESYERKLHIRIRTRQAKSPKSNVTASKPLFWLTKKNTLARHGKTILHSFCMWLIKSILTMSDLTQPDHQYSLPLDWTSATVAKRKKEREKTDRLTKVTPFVNNSGASRQLADGLWTH